MINALCKFEEWEMAIDAFRLMGLEGIESSSFTLVSMALVCSNLGGSDGLRLGKQVHGYSLRFNDRKTFTNNSLMAMYPKLGQVKDSEIVFEVFAERDMISWNTMISALAQKWPEIHAFVLRNGDLIANSFVTSALVDMYCNCKQVESGRRLFDDALKRRLGLWLCVLPCCAALSTLDVAVGSALVDMFAKCGCISLARKIFYGMPTRNVISWNVILMAYGMHGKGEEALKLSMDMLSDRSRNRDLKPNEVTFTATFAACSYSGMVDLGRNLFYKIKEDYGIEPIEDHYACIIDLLGQAGQLKEAYKLINSMPPVYGKLGAWSSMLGACCWVHQNVELFHYKISTKV
ncbi:hypothetical protein M9H77_28631 [Catharanthus roseus]|uniref:Uncharacterized protein n=1 Tax=Catharanthus roseus TaxID=4058 RepID=A0ACC0AIK9_CATRO|nr:hypothetical protein M9H77_28631 [Catharanthus roseus]